MVFSKDNRVYQTEVANVLAAGGSKSIYIGQGGWRLPYTQSIEQIEIARKAGAQGIVVYNYCLCQEPVLTDSVSLMDALKTGLFAK